MLDSLDAGPAAGAHVYGSLLQMSAGGRDETELGALLEDMGDMGHLGRLGQQGEAAEDGRRCQGAMLALHFGPCVQQQVSRGSRVHSSGSCVLVMNQGILWCVNRRLGTAGNVEG